MTKALSVYEKITQKLVEVLEKGEELPWTKNWDELGMGGFSAPYNHNTKRKYSGINRFSLLMDCLIFSYQSSGFLTMNNIQLEAEKLMGKDLEAIGKKLPPRTKNKKEARQRWRKVQELLAEIGKTWKDYPHVKKGSSGSIAVFWCQIYHDNPDGEGKRLTDKQVRERKKQGLPVYQTGAFAKGYTVFNLDCVEHFAEEVEKQPELPQKHSAAELLEKTGAKVNWGQDPHYRPGTDEIGLPRLEQIKGENPEDTLFSVAAHELTHWTGHKSRLDRLDAAWEDGKQGYAKEELVAELGAAFLCSEQGVQAETQHAAYLQSWLKALKNDSRFIFSAASKAQKAVDYIHGEIERLATEGGVEEN